MRSSLFINNNYNLKKKTCCYQYAWAIAPPETIFIFEIYDNIKEPGISETGNLWKW